MKDYQEERTFLGRCFYSLTMILSKPLLKFKWLWFLLNITWGITYTFFGLLIALGLLITGHKCEKFQRCYRFALGKSWGGFELGFFFLTDLNKNFYTSLHEEGHSYQNAIYGPFVIFLCVIPSVIRYWYRRLSKKTQKDYDAIWFEGSATDIGKESCKDSLI